MINDYYLHCPIFNHKIDLNNHKIDINVIFIVNELAVVQSIRHRNTKREIIIDLKIDGSHEHRISLALWFRSCKLYKTEQN